MDLEKQVCSLEHARKLQELGVKQDSLFYWISIGILNNKHVGWRLELSHNCNCEEPLIAQEYYSAYTVAELGEMVLDKANGCGRDTQNLFWCQIGIKFFKDKTEANARAKMLIYLLENNLTKQEG